MEPYLEHPTINGFELKFNRCSQRVPTILKIFSAKKLEKLAILTQNDAFHYKN
jgi:hypothetical protein